MQIGSHPQDECEVAGSRVGTQALTLTKLPRLCLTLCWICNPNNGVDGVECGCAVPLHTQSREQWSQTLYMVK